MSMRKTVSNRPLRVVLSIIKFKLQINWVNKFSKLWNLAIWPPYWIVFQQRHSKQYCFWLSVSMLACSSTWISRGQDCLKKIRKTEWKGLGGGNVWGKSTHIEFAPICKNALWQNSWTLLCLRNADRASSKDSY